MFTKSNSETKLEDALARAVSELNDHPVMSDEYGEILDRIARLQKTKDAETRSSDRVSPDTLVLAATNLIGIAMIIRHENLNVIASKAAGFIMRTR